MTRHKIGTALTDREIEILAALADGQRAAAIARRLHITTSTVVGHKFQISCKLGTRTAAHAVAVAYQLGYLTIGDGQTT